MMPPLLSYAPFLFCFCFLCSLSFPFFKFFLPLRAFKEFLNFWKQTAGKGFYFMLGDIYIRLLFCHISPFLFNCQGTMPHRSGENFCLYYHLSFTVCRCCRFSSASISGGIRSTSRCKLSNSLFSFARSIVSFILPFSLAFALASSFSFSANRSLIVTC